MLTETILIVLAVICAFVGGAAMGITWRRARYVNLDEATIRLRCLLHSTYDRQIVDDSILEIDEFDAGAVDGPLREHIMAVFRRMRLADDERDKRLRRLIEESLAE